MLPTAPAILANVSPNTTGLPGISSLSNMVGALLSIGLIACVAGLVIAAMVWTIGSHSPNPSLASRGKTGVLVALGGPLRPPATTTAAEIARTTHTAIPMTRRRRNVHSGRIRGPGRW